MITSLKEKEIVTDSMISEYRLLTEYESLSNITPILKPVDGIITQGIRMQKNNQHKNTIRHPNQQKRMEIKSIPK